MWVFYPSEGLPQTINLLESELYKLKFYRAQLWQLTEQTKLIYQIPGDNRSREYSVYRTRMGVKFCVYETST